jgi:outer membrane protein OmpA-like peptidoglycan-associated protein
MNNRFYPNFKDSGTLVRFLSGEQVDEYRIQQSEIQTYMNFFAAFNDTVSPEVINKAAIYVEESAPKTQKAIEGLGLTLLGGLLKRITSEIGVNQLYNYIQKGDYDGSLTANLANTLKDPAQTHTLITHGNDTISHLLPAMKSSIANMICSYAGIRNSSALSLLGLTSGIVLDVLGKHVRDGKMDADALATALFEQRDEFMQKVPDSLMPQLVEKVGLQQIVAGVAAPYRRVATPPPTGRSAGSPVVPISPSYETANTENEGNSSLAKIGIFLLIGAVVAVIGYMIYYNSKNQAIDDQDARSETTSTTDASQTDTVARSMDVPADSTQRVVTRTATPIAGTTTAAPVAVAVPAANGPLATQLNAYMADVAAPKGRTFPLSAVTFQPGSASLTPSSAPIIMDIANFLKTNPAAQIRLVGYANDAQGGITNKSLSFKRVNAIKTMLVAQGIDYIRVDAIGLGTGVKIKPGDSTATRQPSMKKIDMKVVYK